MKSSKFLLSAFAIATIACTGNLSAQNTWIGPNDGVLSTAGNWSDGVVPLAANPGTIDAGTGDISLANVTGYVVTQNGGDVFNSAGRTLTDGNWTINGGSIGTGAGFNFGGTQIFTLTGGSVNAVNSVINAGTTVNIQGGTFDLTNTSGFAARLFGTLNISGGTVTLSEFLRGEDGSVVNISGGTLSVAGSIGRSAANTFTGGTTTADSFVVSGSTNITMGAGSVGSLTVGSFSPAPINWLTGSQMSMTVTGSSTWAETEWGAGRMTYNNQDFSVLGNWATVTGTGGLGGGANFSYVGNTLSVIPEPSTWAVLTVGLIAMVIFRRRRQA